jgi:hypothetical protein
MKMVNATTRKFLRRETTRLNGLLDVDGNKVAIGGYNKKDKSWQGFLE